MIHEVDQALRTLIERDALAGTDVEVVFDAPTKDWAVRRTVPTVDVYLYDIREDLRRRERGLINSYEGDRITSRQLPPRYFKLSYLVTAWTQRPEDEHRLLASLLETFLRWEALPTELVTGPLAELGLPVPVTIAMPPPEDRSFADVWSALGGELKPSLDIVITAPTATGRDYVAAPAVLGPASLSLGGRGSWPPTESRLGRLPASNPAAGVNGTGGGTGSGNDGSAGAEGGAAPSRGTSRGLSWHQLGGVTSSPPPASAEGAPPRRRGPAVKRKDT